MQRNASQNTREQRSSIDVIDGMVELYTQVLLGVSKVQNLKPQLFVA